MSSREDVQIREATPRDADAIATLFFETVRRVNSRDYDPNQIEAWAGAAPDPGKWAARMARMYTFIASRNGEVVGFAGFESDGHVDTLYVHHAHQGQGIASRLLDHLMATAAKLNVPRLYTEASITARPFFERRDFVIIAAQEVERSGTRLRNYRMERHLAAV